MHLISVLIAKTLNILFNSADKTTVFVASLLKTISTIFASKLPVDWKYFMTTLQPDTVSRAN